MKPLKHPWRVAAIALLIGFLGLLLIETAFFFLNAPFKQDIAVLEQQVADAYGVSPAAEIILVNIDPFTPLDIPLRADIQREIFSLCEDAGVPFEVIMGLAYTESHFQPDVISRTRDHGMMQINECNHRWLRDKGITDFYDPVQSVQAALYILGPLWEKNGPHGALMAYQYGEAGARAKGWVSSPHSRQVMEQASLYEVELYYM